MDEVTYVDPGLNLTCGMGWISTTYPFQTDHEFFAGTSPLYPVGLSLWARVFGVSMVSARTYCYCLAALGTFLLWLGTFRFNLLTPAYRLMWLTFFSMEYAMNWMARNNRYDVWIFVGLGLAWFGASLHPLRLKYAVIFTGCFLIPFGGFVGVPYVFLAAGLVIILSKFKFLKEAVTAMSGAVPGVVGVGLFYLAFGKLDTFRNVLHNMTFTEQSKTSSLFKVFLYPMYDCFWFSKIWRYLEKDRCLSLRRINGT